MIYSMKNMLNDAYKNHYGIVACNFENFDMLEGIIQGAQEAKTPIIIQTTEPAVAFLGAQNVVYMVKAISDKYGVAAALHLDHGEDLAVIHKCIAAGYDSVMIDYGSKAIQENIIATNKILEIAKVRDIAVEAEIGYVGSINSISKKTDVSMACEFMKHSPVDALAVSIGNIHGGREKLNRIDFELLEELFRRIPIPLVLHGSSGIVEEDITKSVQYGICKVNIETELRQVFKNAIKNYLEYNPSDLKPRNIMGAVREAIKEAIILKTSITNSRNTYKL